MYAKPAHYSDLPKGTPERAVYRLARIAVGNTIMGGCSALVIAKRAHAMGLPMAGEFDAAVSDVYASSSGRVPDHLQPWECGECGTIHLDADAAQECCGECDIDDDDRPYENDECGQFFDGH